MFVILFFILLYYLCIILPYKKTTYYKITHNTHRSVIRDKGKLGEYNIYCTLKKYEKTGAKFLFNLYIPLPNGKTTEIDVIMIHKNCVFVFESKYYSGWIFGNENNKYWTQVLNCSKEHFYNPILQNKTHCYALKNFLPHDVKIIPVTVFSNKCCFKNISINKGSNVIHNNELFKTVNFYLKQNDDKYSVDYIFDKLYCFSQVSEEIKLKHVNDVESTSHM